jgi:hypothetical protein
MSSVKPKRRKIPYIGERLTLAEFKADYNITPEDEAAVARAFALMHERRNRPRTKKRTSNKTARAK